MSDNFDEVTSDATRAMRMALMLGSQAAEQLARLRAEHERRAGEATRERAEQIREQLASAREAARLAYEPVADPRRFAHASSETAAAAWATAAAWAEADPRAAAAEASLAEQIRQRWGLDPQALREQTAHRQDETRAERGQQPEQDADRAGERDETRAEREQHSEQDERLAEAMDPQWRENATTEDLEQRWHEANIDQPGAAHAREALEATLAERLGVDLERFRRESEPTLTETVFNAAGDRSAEAADRAAEGSERTESAAWESRASEERSREGAAEAGDDPGLAIEESTDAREAEGMAVRADAEAETDHASANLNESRADVEGMQQAGVPPRSQQVRTNTARGFGSTPNAGAQAKHHPKARKNTRSAGKAAEKDMGR